MEPTQDPSRPGFWETRFRQGQTPWDAGGVPQLVDEYIATASAAERVLIPGCGAAYEARAFAEAGFEVVAIDFSPAAVEIARKTLGHWRDIICQGDFFTFNFGETFDLIYERAFLCALPRHLWRRYAMRAADLLHSGGKLLGFFFFADREGGPPFGLKQGELGALLGDAFIQIADREVSDSIRVFAERERWQVWERTANAPSAYSNADLDAL